MTRINLIEPKLLSDLHALAEYRELPMVLGSLRRSLKSKNGVKLEKLPKEFTLNKGHVSFFYPRLTYLEKRYNNLISELLKRGYNLKPEERNVDFTGFPTELYNDFKPRKKDKEIIIERIKFRMEQKPHLYFYYGKPVGDSFFSKLERS